MSNDDFRRAVEQIKLRAPIEEIVREYVPELKKAGALWVACCPFHGEKTPSFKVDPRRGHWHCYGACSAGGDQIDFVERFERIAFRDAVEILAARTGVELPRGTTERRSRDEDNELSALLERAQRLFSERLAGPEGEPARQYLAQRGLAQDTVNRFGLGWAPRHGRELCDGLASVEGGFERLEAVGLARKNAEGRPYDFFRGRLVIPIKDLAGRTVGFGARKIDDGDGPKYVNTPETRLFHKGRLIYALDRALPEVRRTGHLVLVEGYTDVMAAHQAGLCNVAAVLGTATTEEHAGLVRRSGARRISLVFDGDEAGRKAALKALAGLLPLGVELDVVRIEGGQDPCDVLVREGREPFAARLELAAEWFEFLCDGLAGLGGAALAREVDVVLELVGRLGKPVHRDMQLAELARRLELPVATLREQWQGLAGRGPLRAARPAAPSAPSRVRGSSGSGPTPALDARAEDAPRPVEPALRRAYEELVGAVLCDPALVPLVRNAALACPDAELREVLSALSELYEDDQAELDLGGVLDRLIERPARARVVPLAEHARRANSPRELLEAQLRFLERRRLQTEKSSLERELGDLERAAGALDDAVHDPRAIELTRELTRICEALLALSPSAREQAVPR